MRLTSKEIKALKIGVQVFCQDIPYTLYLFGSRVDDYKKGGDIDLLIVVDKEFKERLISDKNKIRSKIFEFIPEQRIDITVATPEELVHDQFLQSLDDKIQL